MPGSLIFGPSGHQIGASRFVDAHFARQEKRPLEAAGGADAYTDARLRGTAFFDYSNNDQRFVIGEGLNLFETHRSKASDSRIHAVRDAPSMDAITLAKGVANIADVRDAVAYDFSSRHRTPLGW